MHSDNKNLPIPESWGVYSLYPFQTMVLERLQQGHSGLLVLPTGGGKSLIFQLWSYSHPGWVIVLTPLIALIEDQYQRARALGLATWRLHSALDREKKATILEQLSQNPKGLLFVTPERFRSVEFMTIIKNKTVALLVVDEAHLISQWGYDFRPDYQKIGQLIRELGHPQVLALTATATAQVRQDICTQLNLNEGFQEVAPLVRNNLALNVHEVYGFDQKIKWLTDYLSQQKGAVIIYCTLIKTLMAVVDELERVGIKCLVYHGELPTHRRHQQQKRFIQQDHVVMVATPAFGLGIDKANIRSVIHLELPGSVESYFQEVGRAGRDDLPAQAHLLYDQDDLLIQMDFIQWSNPQLDYIKHVFDWIQSHPDQLGSMEMIELKKQLQSQVRLDYRLETVLRWFADWGVLAEDINSHLGYRESEWQGEWADLVERYLDRSPHQQKLLYLFLQYLKNEERCRMQWISHYFGQETAVCGRCDICERK